ncbi:MAG: radical SAM protein [Limnobacter sp.]|nr:radical SAM protein [Limnobacter sp.]
MSTKEIAAYGPYKLENDGLTPKQRARKRMEAQGLMTKGQHLGHRWAIGCVSLEITQRCNLDCTLCYLSESAEAVKDIPIDEVFRRIDEIRAMYGPNTDIQISGGDPTLRQRDELMAIVRKVRDSGMRPSLFTNGIKASRDMLEELVENGLVDVAFHVDLTQERKGYTTEVELNEVRQEYIERARGLPLSIFFNTTVYDGNFHEIPKIVDFMVKNSDIVRLASFQLQADTGRGVLTERDFMISQTTVADQIRKGAGCNINFDSMDIGHSKCNKYAMTLVADNKVHDVFYNTEYVQDVLATMGSDIVFDRQNKRQVVEQMANWVIKNPKLLPKSLGWLKDKTKDMAMDIFRAKGKVNKLSFFIHNFMDACHLEKDRIDSCVFMVATAEGPISMCLNNAKRDDFLLKPIAMPQAEGVIKFWNPITGKLQDNKPERLVVEHTRKTARGRTKEKMDAERLAAKANFGRTESDVLQDDVSVNEIAMNEAVAKQTVES